MGLIVGMLIGTWQLQFLLKRLTLFLAQFQLIIVGLLIEELAVSIYFKTFDVNYWHSFFYRLLLNC